VTAPTTAQHAMSLGGALHDMMVALAPGTGVAGAHSAACRDSQMNPSMAPDGGATATSAAFEKHPNFGWSRWNGLSNRD